MDTSLDVDPQSCTLLAFYRDAGGGVRPFGGQLEPAFQRRLCAENANVTPEDCHFYHTLSLGNGKVVPGGWDMRGIERSYLGHTEVAGQRVLEFGAASGYLTFWMEAHGAEVTAFDLPPGHGPDLVPLPGIDLDANARSGAETARQVRNGWWYGHRELNSKAKAVYGDIYRLPEDIGRYDISTFGSILLHLANPFQALREAARVTGKALIVTDILPDMIFGDDRNSFVEFNPGDESSNLVNWWRCSPAAIAKMFRVLGFPHVDTHYFQIFYHPHHKPDAAPERRFMFAAVGQRQAGSVRRVDKTAGEIEMDRTVRGQVPVITVENYNDAHRRLQAIHRSFAWKLTKPWRMLMGE